MYRRIESPTRPYRVKPQSIHKYATGNWPQEKIMLKKESRDKVANSLRGAIMKEHVEELSG